MNPSWHHSRITGHPSSTLLPQENSRASKHADLHDASNKASDAGSQDIASYYATSSRYCTRVLATHLKKEQEEGEGTLNMHDSALANS
jgi:hypothetical protein